MAFLRAFRAVLSVPAVLLLGVLLVFAPANAATLTYEYATSFGDPGDPDSAPPDGPGPWLTAVFDDGDSAGTVELTLTVGAIGIAEVAGVYFNLDPSLDVGSLSLVRNAGASTGPAENDIVIGTDASSADGSGLYDIWIDLPPPGGDRFEAGETLVYDIAGISSLTASSFLFYSTPKADDTAGPFLTAARVGSTGSASVVCNSPNGPIGECSDWITAVPVPASVWLFGSAVGLLGWMRRKSN